MMVIKAKSAQVEFRLDKFYVRMIVAVTFTVFRVTNWKIYECCQI